MQNRSQAYYVQYIMYFLLCVHGYSNTRLYEYRYVLVSFFLYNTQYVTISSNVYSGNYPMYLCVYCVMFDIYSITHAILLIFLSLSIVNCNNCSLSIYVI